MLGLLKNEIYKAFRLRKLYLFAGVLLAVQVITVFQYYFSESGELLSLLNGQSFPLEVIRGIPLIMVIFIAVLVSDMIVDEYRKGTLKLVLLRPVSRAKLITAKALALLVIITSLVCFTIVTSYIIGAIAFEWGENIILNGIPYNGNGYAMTLKAAFSCILPYWGFGMLVIFIALLSENVGITIGSSLALYIILPFIESYGNIKKYSIMNLLHSFYHSVLINKNLKQILTSVVIIAGYVILFYVCSIIIFCRKDVL